MMADNEAAEAFQDASQDTSQDASQDDSPGAGTFVNGGTNGNDDDDDKRSESQHLAPISDNYQLSKSCIELLNIDKRTNRSGCSSPAWQYYALAKVRNDMLDELLTHDKEAHDIITTRAATNSSYPLVAVCRKCFDNQGRSLFKSIRVSIPYHAGNFGSHLKTHSIFLQPAKPKPNMSGYKRRSPPFTGNNNYSKRPATSIGHDKKTGEFNSPCSSGSAFDINHKMGQALIIDRFHDKVFNFANNNNLSTRSVAHADRPEFRDLIAFVIAEAGTLRNISHSKLFMGKDKFTGTRAGKYEELIAGTAFYIKEVSDFYSSLLKKAQPFIIVAHDGWDSDKKDMLGITIFFYHPVRRRHFRIPIALMHVHVKDAESTADIALKMLARVGVTKEMIFRSVNDTANTAVKTGQNLSGEKGTCSMHTTDLVMEHATGQVTRTRNKVIVDSFPACEATRRLVHGLVAWLHNKKSKKRYFDYEVVCLKTGRNIVKFTVPNSTRVSGTWSMYLSVTRGRWNLKCYWHHKHSQCPRLTNSQFVTVAQLEAVLWPAARLSKLVQSDKKDSLAYVHLHTMNVFIVYVKRMVWYVANVDEESNNDDKEQWNGNAKWPDRTQIGKPINPMKPFGLTEVSFVKVNKDNLSSVASTLIDRIALEMTKYGVNVTNDQLIAMATNPLSATVGMDHLEACVHVLGTEKEAAYKPFQRLNYRKKCKEALLTFMLEVCAVNVCGSTSAPAAAKEASSSDTDDDEDDPLYQGRKKLDTTATGRDKTAKQILSSEIDRFFGTTNYNDWQAVVKDYTGDEKLAASIGTSQMDHAKHWHTIAKCFDSMVWWKATGKAQYPHIYIAACLFAGIPDSNGHQERTFSAATWMDGKLNNRQSDATFEMKVLIYRNQEFLHQVNHEMTDVDEHRKLAAKATLDLLQKAEARQLAGGEEDGEDNACLNVDDGDEEEDLSLFNLVVNRKDDKESSIELTPC